MEQDIKAMSNLRRRDSVLTDIFDHLLVLVHGLEIDGVGHLTAIQNASVSDSVRIADGLTQLNPRCDSPRLTPVNRNQNSKMLCLC